MPCFCEIPTEDIDSAKKIIRSHLFSIVRVIKELHELGDYRGDLIEETKTALDHLMKECSEKDSLSGKTLSKDLTFPDHLKKT